MTFCSLFPEDMLKSFIASRALMEEFEDAKKLSRSENGCLLLQLIKVSAQGVFTISINMGSADCKLMTSSAHVSL